MKFCHENYRMYNIMSVDHYRFCSEGIYIYFIIVLLLNATYMR